MRDDDLPVPVRAWRWLRASSLRFTLALLVALSVPAAALTFGGNQLLGDGLTALLGPRLLPQLVAGLVWTVVGLALCVCSDQVRSRRLRRTMVVVGTAMLVLSFVVAPVGRPDSLQGAGEYAPGVALGVLVGAPLGGGLLWVLRRPLREARRGRERARLERDGLAQDHRRYRLRLRQLGGDVAATEASFRVDRRTRGSRVPARPADVVPPADRRTRRRRRR